MVPKSRPDVLAGHDVVKLFLRHQTVQVLVGFLDHFLQLVLVDIFS